MENNDEELIKILKDHKGLPRILSLIRSPEYMWSGVSIILGIIALIVSLIVSWNEISALFQQVFSFIFSDANAQTSSTSALGTGQPLNTNTRTYLIGGMMIGVGFMFVWALLTLSLSNKPKAVHVAQEAVKTLLGFFIGSLTGFLGSS